MLAVRYVNGCKLEYTTTHPVDINRCKTDVKDRDRHSNYFLDHPPTTKLFQSRSDFRVSVVCLRHQASSSILLVSLCVFNCLNQDLKEKTGKQSVHFLMTSTVNDVGRHYNHVLDQPPTN